MKILVIGSSGTLGKPLYNYLKKKFKIFNNGVKKQKFNLAKKGNIEKLLKISKPEIVINCVGIPNIDYCEKYKKITYEANVEIVKNILSYQKKYNFYFIHISTDHLYDTNSKKLNRESLQPKINNEYSRQKREAENICSKYKSIVFRTNFFGKEGKKTLDNWLYKNLKKKNKINLFKDVYFNPLRINTLCKIFEKILINKNLLFKKGIYNLGSKNSITKENFALLFAKKLNLKYKYFKSINVNNFLKTKRSKFMGMNCKKFEKEFKINLPKIENEIAYEAKKYI